MTASAMRAAAFAAAAQALAGVPFRLHGRDPATGLDCIGLIVAALAACGRSPALPNGYRLSQRTLPDLSGFAAANGFAETREGVRAGDVLLLRVGPAQVHFAIALPHERFVHAHAGLGRVALGEPPLPWPILRRWRLCEEIS